MTDHAPGLPAVTAVIPTHARWHLLRKAVESVLHQTAPPAEVIVVDDGSPERDPEVEALLEEAGVRLLRNETARGGSAARNRGWRATDTPLVAFLDDDDLWTPDKLEVQVPALVEAEADYAWAAYREVDRETLEPGALISPEEGDARTLLRYSNLRCSTLLARRSALERVGGFDETLPRNQDWDLFLRLARACQGVYVDRNLLRARTHRPNPDALMEGRLRFLEKWRELVEALPAGERRDVLAEHHWLLWSNHALAGNLAGERKHLMEALRRRPLRFRYLRSALLTLLHHLGWRGRTAGRGGEG